MAAELDDVGAVLIDLLTVAEASSGVLFGGLEPAVDLVGMDGVAELS